jgi:hypothetical protein
VRQLSWSVCVAVLLAVAIVRGQPPTCETTIFVQKNPSGTLEIADPAPMKCAPGEQMTVHFVNRDTAAGYRVQISDIGCKVGGARGKNPTRGFLRVPVDLTPGGTKDLISGIPPRKPAVLSRPEVSNLNCASGGANDFRYKYVIRANGRGSNTASAQRDPDLEIST